ncbi:unnamed protein product [Gongylonema pulchrum]|uniref:Transposase n=1 Tax=Gongylonema pulchrum TaxID=637853 RepID=A0A183EJ87_9BILA|nr:unnamed protein product [Gongylonema pulchrum]
MWTSPFAKEDKFMQVASSLIPAGISITDFALLPVDLRSARLRRRHFSRSDEALRDDGMADCCGRPIKGS